MIDEELYQQATDELNSDKRRPHLWARACALASDDHDEARYLYTNLRVEELLADRAQQPATPPTLAPDDPVSSELELEPITFAGGDAAAVTPEISSSRAGMDSGAKGAIADDAFDAPLDEGTMRPYSVRTERQLELDPLAEPAFDSDAVEAMNDGESDSGIDEGLGLAAEEAVLAGGRPGDSDIADSVEHETLDDAADWLDGDLSLGDAAPVPLGSADLQDADAEDIEFEAEPAAAAFAADPEPEFDAVPPSNGGFPSLPSSDLTSDTASAPPTDDIFDPPRPDVALAAAASLNKRRAEGQQLDAMLDHQAPADRLDPVRSGNHGSEADAEEPFDLAAEDDIVELDGRGALWAVYETGDGKFKALRRGVSVGAVLFTLPWLLLRGLAGTAIVYTLLWLVVAAGLLLTGLAWLDAGDSAPNLLKAACMAFAAIAALGLIIVPFLRANRWREKAWQRRGYALRGELRARNRHEALHLLREALAPGHGNRARS